MFRIFRFAFGSATLSAIGLALGLAPFEAQAKSLRKIDPATGTGSCIFSPQELPKGGEGSSAYLAARTDYTEGEDVHIRCYWPRKLSTFRTQGKIFNEIRDKNRYSYGLFWIMPGLNGGPGVERLIQDMASEDAAGAMAWDQQRFDLYENKPDCDVKVQDGKLKRDYGVTSPYRCLSLGNYARKMRQTFSGLESQRTFRFCFKQYVEVADKQVTYTGKDATDPWRLRRLSTTMHDTYPVVIAQGCFNYTLGIERERT